jgi:hypothetical protein
MKYSKGDIIVIDGEQYEIRIIAEMMNRPIYILEGEGKRTMCINPKEMLPLQEWRDKRLKEIQNEKRRDT